jgi:hypothetical protein
MGYVIAAVIVLVIVAIGVTMFVVSAARRQRPAAIAAPDDQTPLGDTAEHAGEQSREGRTVPPERGERDEPAGPESERLANRPR